MSAERNWSPSGVSSLLCRAGSSSRATGPAARSSVVCWPRSAGPG